MGVALEVGGNIVEDATWLRKEPDCRHINVAELEAVARGINLAIEWGFKTFTVATDSCTVVNWMDCAVEGVIVFAQRAPLRCLLSIVPE